MAPLNLLRLLKTKNMRRTTEIKMPLLLCAVVYALTAVRTPTWKGRNHRGGTHRPLPLRLRGVRADEGPGGHDLRHLPAGFG